MRRHVRVWVATVVALCGVGVASAAAEWECEAYLYMHGASLSGESGIGPVVADVDVSFSELLENLELGGMTRFIARNGRWGISADLYFAGLGQTKDSPRVDVDVDQWIVELAGTYDLAEGLGVVFGGRYVRIDMGVEIGSPTVATADDEQDWVDPIVGLLVRIPLGKNWRFAGRADVGGGVGADLTWQAEAYVAVQLSERVDLGFGYRALDIDYDDGEGAERFLYDVLIAGPVAGVGIRF